MSELAGNQDKSLLLRSMLFVPAHIDKFFNSAVKSTADVLVLDLEDAVPADQKEQARETLKNKINATEFDRPLFIRVNAQETGLMEKDLEVLALPKINGFMAPKVKNVQDVKYFEDLLVKLEQKNNLPLGKFSILPLIETTEAVLNVLDIAKASKRIICLVFGQEDFLADLQAEHCADQGNLLVPRAIVAMAARAAGCQPIDGPYLQIKDVQGCAEHTRGSRKLGFSGRLVLHPLQIEIANKEYVPTEEEIEKAKKIITLNEQAKTSGRSIAFTEGKFIAPPVLKQAEQILEISKIIKSKNNAKQ